jgi:hypothetical protein
MMPSRLFRRNDDRAIIRSKSCRAWSAVPCGSRADTSYRKPPPTRNPVVSCPRSFSQAMTAPLGSPLGKPRIEPFGQVAARRGDQRDQHPVPLPRCASQLSRCVHQIRRGHLLAAHTLGPGQQIVGVVAQVEEMRGNRAGQSFRAWPIGYRSIEGHRPPLDIPEAGVLDQFPQAPPGSARVSVCRAARSAPAAAPSLPARCRARPRPAAPDVASRTPPGRAPAEPPTSLPPTAPPARAASQRPIAVVTKAYHRW